MQNQKKWRARIGNANGFYKLSGTALKKWTKLQVDLKNVKPVLLRQPQLYDIEKQFMVLEATIISNMTKAVMEKDGEIYYKVDTEMELMRRE